MKHIGRKKILLIATIVIFIILGSFLNVFASTTSELKQKQQQNQKEINEAKEQQEKIRSQMTDIQKQVDELDSKISDYQTEINDLTSQIDDISKNIELTQQELTRTENELKEKENLLETRLVASYKAGDTTYLDVLLSSDSLTSFLSNYYLVEQISENDTKLINTIKETKVQIEESKKQLEENKVTLETAKQTQVDRKNELDVAKKEKEQAVAKLSEEDQEVQKKIDEMRSEDVRIQAAIKKAEAAASRPAVSNRGNSTSSNSGTSTSSDSNPGGFIYPVPAGYRTITTGMYYHESKKYHGAIDFGSGGIAGQPVYAAKEGTVILAENLKSSYGTYIIIKHDNGLYSLYAHGQAGSICVSEGQYVSQGQQIMRVGSTGNSTGAHLHFEIRVSPGGYNNRVNPQSYLK